MREILFRGKRMDNGKWIYGTVVYPISINGDSYAAIVPIDEGVSVYSMIREVAPETVGQYTGLTDKNGVKIFEGDIMEWVNDDGTKAHYVVRMNDEMGGWVASHVCSVANVMIGYASPIFEVIGNIHDNPELLEVAK